MSGGISTSEIARRYYLDLAIPFVCVKLPVPQEVIERLLERREVPDRTKAHRVDWMTR
jgi:hypothetical protein